MPTGYTARLYDGEQDFDAFVRGAARGMGAFMHLRDAGPEVPLTYPEDNTPYYIGLFKENLRANLRWRQMSEEEKYTEWSEYVERASVERDNSEWLARRDRFDAMIEQVKSVDVPEKLQTFKDFMLEQLGTEFQYSREPYKPEIMDFYEWCDSETYHRQRMEDVYRKHVREARDRYREVCEFIDLLGETFGFEVER